VPGDHAMLQATLGCHKLNFFLPVVLFKMSNTTEKRPLAGTNEETPKNKKQKKESDTIPILRGRFKQRWLTKHSHLLKKSDEANGILVSCNVNAETRALGQLSTCLEHYIVKLFPEHQSTWVRFEGTLDIDELDIEQEEKEDDNETKEEETKLVETDRKEKKFQAIDAACGGLVFYRFRINVKPTDFTIKLMGKIREKNKTRVILTVG
jgi:HD superfamily phosphohydrolase